MRKALCGLAAWREIGARRRATPNFMSAMARCKHENPDCMSPTSNCRHEMLNCRPATPQCKPAMPNIMFATPRCKPAKPNCRPATACCKSANRSCRQAEWRCKSLWGEVMGRKRPGFSRKGAKTQRNCLLGGLAAWREPKGARRPSGRRGTA